MERVAEITTSPLREAAERLLATAGVPGPITLSALPGGANNRVYRLRANQADYLLKAYFQHARDTRDRLRAEFDFCRFAWDHGVHSVPCPIAYDAEYGIAVYDFIEGRRCGIEDVDEGAVQTALRFISALNQHRGTSAARALPVASDAYFTIAGHLGNLERRVQALNRIRASTRVGMQARDFVRSELTPLFTKVRAAAIRSVDESGLAVDSEIPREQRRLSPSDFGFHNALRTPSGELCFIDFEYAGWDDPAKTVCDFFCQIAVPVPVHFFSTVLEGVVGDVDNAEDVCRRVRVLMPIYRLKWCCIVLNDFLDVDAERRIFAGGPENREPQQMQQLLKARNMLRQMRETGEVDA